METRRLLMILVMLPCCLAIILFIVVTSLVIHHSVNQEPHKVQGYLTQVLEDWDTKPLTDLIVIPVDESFPMMPTYCPTNYPDQVIYKVWPGTFPYCDCSVWQKELAVKKGHDWTKAYHIG